MIKNCWKISQFKFHILVQVWCCFNLSKSAHSARILGIFPVLAKSHFNFHEEIMRNLAEAGHQVTMIGPYPLSRPHQNLTLIDSQTGRKINEVVASGAKVDYWFDAYMNGIFHWFGPDCSHVMAMQEVKNLKNNYDVIFVELILMYKCYLPLAKKLDVPVIGTTTHRSFYHSDHSAGNSRNPAVYPKENTFLSRKMPFFERLLNLFEEILYELLRFIENKQLETFFMELTGYPKENLNTSISLVFSNNHDIFVPRPLAQNVINIGGIGLKLKKLNPLPQDLENFINEAEHGVILFSFGTIFNTDTLRPDVITNIKKAFAKIPQRIIWKLDRKIEGMSDNVLFKEWVPQKEVLAHKNVLAFMSHCGLNSVTESIYFGKPLILLPLFADQASNAGILSSLGVGIYMNILTIQSMELVDAVKEVINNPKYQKNMKMLSKRFKDDPMTPAQKVIYWTEYVLKHKGAQHLRWVEADMSSYQYFLIDIIGFIIIVFIFTIFVLYFLAKCSPVLLNMIYLQKLKPKCKK